MKSVSEALENVMKVDNVVNWTDSMISLWWIRNTEEEYLTELRGMGVVKSLITGRDGYHRGAVVRVRS